MDSSSTAKMPRLGLSLYADLLDGQTSGSAGMGTIPRAPVVSGQGSGGTGGFDDNTPAQRQQPIAAPLRFQPTKRPQAPSQKPKTKSTTQKPGTNPSADASQSFLTGEAAFTGGTLQTLAKTTLSDWAAEPQEDDVNGFYSNEKRQRGGRKKRRKNKELHAVQNWDDIYNPSRPNAYEEYQNSDEKISEIREWKDRLYAHRTACKGGDSSHSKSEDGQLETSLHTTAPSGFSFAPPANFETYRSTRVPIDDATSEDAHPSLHRLVIERHGPKSTHDDTKKELLTPSISRAPVRYNLPPPPSEIPESEADLAQALASDGAEIEITDHGHESRSLRPGQKGFAHRLMSKYGWTKGSGLGANGTGIVNPLRVQVEKQKKKPDSEGGGYVAPGGRGKIVGEKKAGGPNASGEGGKFGVMSEVVVLHGMVDGLDLDSEMESADDGGLIQEIGDECGAKYGRVERVFIDRSGSTTPRVFVKFTSQLSALRAVNALEGRIFNGNSIVAMFYDRESFDAGTAG
ncbi:MAG: hypothetical protein Q9212_003428 [Teloschistes hypoglaucus]